MKRKFEIYTYQYVVRTSGRSVLPHPRFRVPRTAYRWQVTPQRKG